MQCGKIRWAIFSLVFFCVSSFAFPKTTLIFDDGRSLQGDIEKLNKKKSILTVKTEGKKKSFKLSELQSLNFRSTENRYRQDFKKIAEQDDTFFLADGQVLYGRIAGLDKKRLEIETGQAGAKNARYPVASIDRIYLASGLTDFDRKEVGGGLNFFSSDEEVKMGKSYAQDVEKQVEILNDPEVESYVDELGQRLARTSRRPDISYHFRVVNTADINAFAIPGGFVYVNRGLIEKADNESELAGVLAHEIGHVAGRHSTRQMSKQLLTAGILAAAGAAAGAKSDTAGQLVSQGGGAFAFFTFMKYSRDMERQADLLGLHNLHAAGYDGNGMVTFFDKLKEEGKGDPSRFETFFSTHPSPAERVENVGEELRLMKDATDKTLDTPEFERVKRHLKELPPPPKAKKQ
jgi:Zn-dependent protease with chaperone function